MSAISVERGHHRTADAGQETAVAQPGPSRSGSTLDLIARMNEHRLYTDHEFGELVRSALDELPPKFKAALENVAVVVSDRGAEHHAYGLYVGSMGRGASYFGGPTVPDRIFIFRDTLVRDFGDNHERLRAHVVQTVLHEVGHHLGFDEAGVRKLGL
jgi:predicted Zn-dependent protease with MMP-like domain